MAFTTTRTRRTALFATVAALSVLAAGQALAQQTAPPLPTAAAGSANPPTAGSEGGAQVEAIVVTGTAIRGVAPTGSATVNITRDTLVQSGVSTPGQLITQLPQGSSLGTTLDSSGGRSAGVNLRGLGNNATLLLFDGHRTVPQGVTNQIADPNTIPFIAIERVEVVTDGASAIYGSDAVAGVVNYILRKNYEGAELTGRYTHTLYDQFTAEALIGHRWDSGSVMLALSYDTNNHVRRSDSRFLSQDLRAFGGNDNRFQGTTVQPGLTPDLIVTNGAVSTVYGLPNTAGGVPTAASVLALQNNPGLMDNASLSDFYTARHRESGVFRLNQNFGRAGELTLTSMFNIRTNRAPGTGDGAFSAIAVSIPANSPYFIQGLGPGTQSVVYNFRANNPGRELDQRNYDGTLNNTLEYKVKLFGDMQFTGTGTYGYNSGCAVCQPQANTTLAAVIAQPANASQFNPYLNGPQATAEKLFGGFTQEARNKLIDLIGKVDGTVFELPGGAARIAVGGEYQKHDFWFTAQNTLNLTDTFQTSRYAKSHRMIESGFAEAFIPIFGTSNAIPFFQKLNLSAAVRYDHYSDLKQHTTNPKFGVSWQPVDDLQLRGSWGTSFRAPTLGESDPRTVGQTNRTFVANGLNDPTIPVGNNIGQSLVLNRTGNSGNLRPETAKVFSFGGDYNPNWARGLKLGATFYSVNYKDRIETLPNQTNILSNPTTFALYRQFFIKAPQPATCVNGAQPGLPGTPQYATYNPAYLPWLSDPNAVYSPTTATDCQLVGIIAGGTTNLSKLQENGLDLSASFTFETGLGRANIGGNFTKILKLKRSLTNDAPLVDAIDTFGNQVSSRGRFNAGLVHGPLAINLFANYTGSYLNNQTITVNRVKLPDTRIPSWTTFDANITYAIPRGDGWMDGTRLSLTVQNFTDKDPPIVLSGTNAIDLANANLWGRIWTFEITKQF